MRGPLLDLFVLLAALDDRQSFGDPYTPAPGDKAALRRLEKRKLIRKDGNRWAITPYGMKWIKRLKLIVGQSQWWRNHSKEINVTQQ